MPPGGALCRWNGVRGRQKEDSRGHGARAIQLDGLRQWSPEGISIHTSFTQILQKALQEMECLWLHPIRERAVLVKAGRRRREAGRCNLTHSAVPRGSCPCETRARGLPPTLTVHSPK